MIDNQMDICRVLSTKAYSRPVGLGSNLPEEKRGESFRNCSPGEVFTNEVTERITTPKPQVQHVPDEHAIVKDTVRTEVI